jgi:hypothetical protein
MGAARMIGATVITTLVELIQTVRPYGAANDSHRFTYQQQTGDDDTLPENSFTVESLGLRPTITVSPRVLVWDGLITLYHTDHGDVDARVTTDAESVIVTMYAAHEQAPDSQSVDVGIASHDPGTDGQIETSIAVSVIYKYTG